MKGPVFKKGDTLTIKGVPASVCCDKNMFGVTCDCAEKNEGVDRD